MNILGKQIPRKIRPYGDMPAIDIDAIYDNRMDKMTDLIEEDYYMNLGEPSEEESDQGFNFGQFKFDDEDQGEPGGSETPGGDNMGEAVAGD